MNTGDNFFVGNVRW